MKVFNTSTQKNQPEGQEGKENGTYWKIFCSRFLQIRAGLGIGCGRYPAVPLRAATVKYIRLTAGTMNESLQANTANAAIPNQFSISETVCVKNTCLHERR